MNGYFKPLRKKIGVVSLAMACLFMGGWVRSRTSEDSIRIVSSDSTTSFGSAPSGLGWSTVYRSIPGTVIQWESAKPQPSAYAKPTESEFVKVRSFGAFYFISRTPPTRSSLRFSTLVIRYWAVVIPLTLLSAWLLLSKVRVKSPPATPK